MARFRIANVRFGGGRKTSVGFHAGPLGVTLGGGRRRSNSSSTSSGGGYEEVHYVDWDSLSDKEKATVPLKSIQVDYSLLSEKDKALIDYRRKRETHKIRILIIASIVVVATIFSTYSPIILGCAALFSILGSIYFSYASITTKRIKPGVEPSDKQLRAWSFVNDDKPLPNMSPAFSDIQSKYGDETARAVQKMTGKKVVAKRKLTFKELVTANFYINFVLLVCSAMAIGIASSDNTSNCVNPTFNYYSGLVWGVEDCFGISEHLSALKSFFVVICISTVIAFASSIFLECKSTYKQQWAPVIVLLKKKTPVNKLKPKDITTNLKQQKAQVKQRKEAQIQAKVAHTQELRERFKKSSEK